MPQHNQNFKNKPNLVSDTNTQSVAIRDETKPPPYSNVVKALPVEQVSTPNKPACKSTFR